MDNEYFETKKAYQLYKGGERAQEFRENLADKLENLKYILFCNESDQSAILSYILDENVIYEEPLLNKIVNEIRYQGTEVVVPTANTSECRPCLVGNIIDEHEFGENHELRRGTKHFGPGTKVYLAPIQWGDGYERVYVIGKVRKRSSMIQVVMSRSKITNFRAQRVYSPVVLKMMEKSEIDWWDNNKDTLDMINELSFFLNNPDFKYGIIERTKKMNRVLDILSEKYEVANYKIQKENQKYPIISIQAYENCIVADYYGYVNDDGSAYKEHYYQISAEEIAERIEKQIESYVEYRSWGVK